MVENSDNKSLTDWIKIINVYSNYLNFCPRNFLLFFSYLYLFLLQPVLYMYNSK